MKKRYAFTLVDVMIALLVLLLGTGGILAMMQSSRRALLETEELAVAHRILYQLARLPTAVLEESNGKTYDFRGLHEGPALFQVGVSSRTEDDYVLWQFEVRWTDASGQKRQLRSNRMVWEAGQ